MEEKTIGYFLDEDKRNKLRWEEFLKIAAIKEPSLKFITINPDQLNMTNPFNLILLRLTTQLSNDSDPLNHKILNNFHSYFQKYPQIKVIDPIDNQKKVINRELMGKTMDLLNQQRELNIKCPKSVLIDLAGDYMNQIPSDFKFPAICKCLKASGSTNSHNMGIFFNAQSLLTLKTSFGQSEWILQEYINHNATIFKVYVLKPLSHVVARVSLPNFNKDHHQQPLEPVIFDSQAWKDKLPPELTSPITGKAQPPSSGVVHKITDALQKVLGLQLFGYDFIVNEDNGSFAVIDINYMPDYRGVDDFHSLLLCFFREQIC